MYFVVPFPSPLHHPFANLLFQPFPCCWLLSIWKKTLLNWNESKSREQIGMSFDLELSCFAATILIWSERWLNSFQRWPLSLTAQLWGINPKGGKQPLNADPWYSWEPSPGACTAFSTFLLRWGDSETLILGLTCPGLELSHTMTSSSAATSGGLSFTSSTWTVTGTWLKRLGLSGTGRKEKPQGQAYSKPWILRCCINRVIS